MFTLHGVWNLDFFWTVISPQCLHHCRPWQLTSMSFACGWYCFHSDRILQACNFSHIITLELEAIQLVFYQDLEDSGIYMIWSLILLLPFLCPVKLLGVLMDLLAPVQVWGVVRNISGVFLYYEARIELFCKEHIPLGLLTIFIILRFNMLHLVHPTFVSTSCGVHSKVYSWSKMPNFAYIHWHTSQGCFKDCLAAIYFISHTLFWCSHIP